MGNSFTGKSFTGNSFTGNSTTGKSTTGKSSTGKSSTFRAIRQKRDLVSLALNVWMNGELVGTWSTTRGHAHTFHYASSWLSFPRRRSLSQSMPMAGSPVIKGDVVAHYFDNLLPDNERIRARLRKRFHTRSVSTFDLLAAIGRDCVGAVQLLPVNREPDDWNRVQCEPMTDQQIAGLLHAVPADDGPESMEDDDLLRISIAGAQEKTALTWYGARWCRPHGATPTTHIIKLPLSLIGGSRRVDASDSVQNEWLCAQIMAALGFPVATTSMATFDRQTVLVVERFDRAWADDGSWIARLPQEDFCQALGLPPEKKYESMGGPGIAHCMRLLQGSADRADPLLFLTTQLAFFLLAATDGHAKNFSIFLQPGDRYEMTPLYDILSIYPYFGSGPSQFNARKAGPAMALRAKNVHKLYHTIEARHWHRLALEHGGSAAWQALLALARRVDAALETVGRQLPAGYPERTWSTIAHGMRAATSRFLGEAATLPEG